MGDLSLSDTERYIMQFFWQNGAMKSDDLAALVKEKGWKSTTLLTFLSRLVKKGMLQIQKLGRSNLYIPVISLEEYRQTESNLFLDEMYGGSAKSFIAAMIDNRGLSNADIEELRQWLNAQEVQHDE